MARAVITGRITGPFTWPLLRSAVVGIDEAAGTLRTVTAGLWAVASARGGLGSLPHRH